MKRVLNYLLALSVQAKLAVLIFFVALSISSVSILINIDMHKNMEEILKRYRGYGKTVRIVSIPGNEDVSKWNPEFPWKFEGEGIRYWVGNINERMDTKILKDILLAGSYNRIISVNEEYGCCLSGYMLDGEEYQQLL